MSSDGGSIKFAMITDVNKAEKDFMRLQNANRKLTAEMRRLKEEVRGAGVTSDKVLNSMKRSVQNAVKGLVGVGGLLLAWREINAAIDHNIRLTQRANRSTFDLGAEQAKLIFRLGTSISKKEAESVARNIQTQAEKSGSLFKANEATAIATALANASSTMSDDPRERGRQIQNVTSLADVFYPFGVEEAAAGGASVIDIAKQFTWKGQTEKDRRDLERWIAGQIGELISQGRFENVEGVAGFAKILTQVIGADSELKNVKTTEGAVARLSADFREAFALDVAVGGAALDRGNEEVATLISNLISHLKEKFGKTTAKLKDGSVIDTAQEMIMAVKQGYIDSKGRIVLPDAAMREVIHGVSATSGKSVDAANMRAKLRMIGEATVSEGTTIDLTTEAMKAILPDIDLNNPLAVVDQLRDRLGSGSGLPAVKENYLATQRAASADVLLRNRFSSADDILFNQERGLVSSSDYVTGSSVAMKMISRTARNFGASEEFAGRMAIGVHEALRQIFYGGAGWNPIMEVGSMMSGDAFKISPEGMLAAKELAKLREVTEKNGKKVEGVAAGAAGAQQGQREPR